MAKPSQALNELTEYIKEGMIQQRLHPGQPVTWGVLLDLLEKSAQSLEQREYEDYMGDDL